MTFIASFFYKSATDSKQDGKQKKLFIQNTCTIYICEYILTKCMSLIAFVCFSVA